MIEKLVPSSDGIHTLHGYLYVPEGEIKGYFHVVHGMTEYIDRYAPFMEWVCRQGYLCFGYDHLGHGRTAQGKEELGYIAPKNGWKYLVDDVDLFASAVKAEYGNKPYLLMGHSMGSFIVRLAAVKKAPDKLIIMGTGGPNPLSGFGIALIDTVKLFKGGKAHSKFLEDAIFKSYNARFGENDPTAWLSKNTQQRRIYAADPYCNFHFTVSALGDLVRLNHYCNRKKWFAAVPENLPILLVSGSDDPVGDFEKGVKTVQARLKQANKKVDVKLYLDCRHEILNDTCREELLQDIADFIHE